MEKTNVYILELDLIYKENNMNFSIFSRFLLNSISRFYGNLVNKIIFFEPIFCYNFTGNLNWLIRYQRTLLSKVRIACRIQYTNSAPCIYNYCGIVLDGSLKKSYWIDYCRSSSTAKQVVMSLK